MSMATEAYIYTHNESELRWMGKTSTHFLATGALTGGAFGLVEEQSMRGVSVPLHKHDNDVESFYILEGEISFFLNDNPGVRATKGSFVHIPGGTIHGFRIESETVRYLILTTPLHVEFYRAISLPLFEAPIDDTTIANACRKYGVEYVGELPV
ncbi:quercetin dioxygenase-like cupin family protein [Ulvibacter sp. MAR_2010_11]|uniref:cupin domain-containing protein n=1 Tax=Ulvibacter sp. MAR_2010_11 TaxID=1250229 RepID=UPI000C2C2D7E|nr:cupin domain-containing protein [Ulvibacter sp. MAR_2010_11]PKA82006.1 quercetin dioxygenase-like cupin family protein [Ulvibacter sp. MAR_2010_11]